MSTRFAVLVVACALCTACERGVTSSPPAPPEHGASPAAPHDRTAAPARRQWGPDPQPTSQSAPEPSPAQAIAFDAAHPSAAGMAWSAPSSFAFRAPATAMRLAEYVVGHSGENDVAMTVFHFPGMGGGIDPNVQRWLGQFTQPDGRSTLAAAHIATEVVASLRVTTVDVRGHFEGGTMGGGTGDDFRLLGAIAEARDGLVFFKLVGPSATVDAAESAFRTLIQSFSVVP